MLERVTLLITISLSEHRALAIPSHNDPNVAPIHERPERQLYKRTRRPRARRRLRRAEGYLARSHRAAARNSCWRSEGLSTCADRFGVPVLADRERKRCFGPRIPS
jgi:hypothetical protein